MLVCGFSFHSLALELLVRQILVVSKAVAAVEEASVCSTDT